MRILIFACTLTTVSTAGAQAPSTRLLPLPDAATPHTLGAAAAVRELPDGRLLVNDTQRRQLRLFDAALATSSIVADSAAGSPSSYGARAGGIIPYLGDSTLFVDPAGLSMFVISPAGRIARVASIPRAQDAAGFANNLATLPGLDAAGRIVYRGLTRVKQVVNGGITTAEFPDSIDIDRIDLETRRVDTIGYFRVAKSKMVITQTEHGMTVNGELNPLQTVDDWAVLSSGFVAVVRGLDYHVDIIRPDKSVAAGPKVPFTWQPLTDEMKTAILDSARAQLSRGVVSGALAAQMLSMHGAGSEGHMQIPRQDPGASGPPIRLVGIDQLPDYQPPFMAGAARADRDGNLWVRTTATRVGAVGGAIYDVIDGRGVLIDRVQLAPGRQVVGFGAHGAVYLSARDETGTWLERTHR